MAESRRHQIEQMLRDDPDDTMLQYMLAMEYDSEGEYQESRAIYRKLMSLSPPHVDSYFRYAQQSAQNGDLDAARETLREGITIAREQDQLHTAAEMSELLQSLGEFGQ